jgi:inorganic pyrophosphatase
MTLFACRPLPASCLLSPAADARGLVDARMSLNQIIHKERVSRLAKNETTVAVMIEIPQGSRNKYEYDRNEKVFRFDRMLFSSVHYPADYGFIPNTLALDGDPLDALVLLWEPTFPGCTIEARPVGLFKMSDEHGPDEKILCVPIRDPLWNHIKKLSDVPPHFLKEIEHFFSIYKDLERKKTRVEGWEDKAAAIKVIEESKKRHHSGQAKKKPKRQT